MKKLFLLIFIPFISFGQCEDGESSIVFSTLLESGRMKWLGDYGIMTLGW